MTFFLTVFFFLLIIGFLVLVHEFGHFAAAKIAKVPVQEFALGFGPNLFKKEYRGTLYKINALPLGGYVSLEGENNSDDPMGYRNRSFPVKFMILMGGIFMNILTAIVFLGIFLLINNSNYYLPAATEYNFHNVESQRKYFPIGIANVSDEWGWENIERADVIIAFEGKVFENIGGFYNFVENNYGKSVEATLIDLDTLEERTKSITIGGRYKNNRVLTIVSVLPEGASDGVLEAGESIYAVNGQTFETADEFTKLVDSFQNSTVEFSILNTETGEITTKELALDARDDEGALIDVILDRAHIGLQVDIFGDSTSTQTYFITYNKNLLAPFSFTYDLTVYQLDVLGDLFSEAFETNDFDEVSEVLGGPVRIGDVVNDVVEYEIYETFIPLTALISLSLAMFNILPIPALDGGQAMIAFIEAVRRKRLSDNTVNKINLLGFTFLIMLSIIILLKDIIQLDLVNGLIDNIEKVFGK